MIDDSAAPPVDAGPPVVSAARLYAVVAALLALAYFGAVLLATGSALPQALRATAFAAVPAVALGFAVLRIGRRARWFDGSRRRLAIVHAALCVGYSALWSAAVVVLFAVDRWLTVDGAPFELRAQAFGFTAFTGVLLYGGVAGAAFGLDTAARLRDERARAARAETLRVRAELAALRAQLNPHFLFNTLHTVLGLVRRDPALAEEALQDLGDVLRYALSVQRDRDQVPLRDELEFVQRYLAIERLRLGDRLRIDEDISPAALDARLPAFTVQPLVENAIRYAVACRAQGGSVRIAARRTGDGPLHLTISDDGATPPRETSGAGQGLGLTLVRQRLEAAHGAAAHLVATRGDTGFTVTIEVPQDPA